MMGAPDAFGDVVRPAPSSNMNVIHVEGRLPATVETLADAARDRAVAMEALAAPSRYYDEAYANVLPSDGDMPEASYVSIQLSTRKGTPNERVVR